MNRCLSPLFRLPEQRIEFERSKTQGRPRGPALLACRVESKVSAAADFRYILSRAGRPLIVY